MKCPSCKAQSFTPKTLTNDLQVLECGNCSGYWLKSFNYWLWRDRLVQTSPEVQGESVIETADSINGKICPECFKFLTRFRVGHGTTITIERCEACRGMWFDKNEWEALHSKGLHDDIHFIFSAGWQRAVQAETALAHRNAALVKAVGEADSKRVMEFAAWLGAHPQRDSALAYVTQSCRG